MNDISMSRDSIKNLIQTIELSIIWMKWAEDEVYGWSDRGKARNHREHLEYIKDELWKAL